MKVNPLDLSPNYAGVLMAITNGIGAITGIIAPYLVGVLTPNVSFKINLLNWNFNDFINSIFQSLLSEWRTVFWIAFGVFNVTNLAYILGASGEVQPFNSPETIKDAEKPKEGKEIIPTKWNQNFSISVVNKLFLRKIVIKTVV